MVKTNTLPLRWGPHSGVVSQLDFHPSKEPRSKIGDQGLTPTPKGGAKAPTMAALANADLTLAMGGVLFAYLDAYSWSADARAKRVLRGRRFDDVVNTSLESRYSDSRSFRSLYNAAHEVANQPIFMVGAMLGVVILAIGVGEVYIHAPDISLPFVVVVFVLGLTLHFGDIIESILVVSYAERSTLTRSDRKSLEYFGRVVGSGKYFLLGLALSVLGASLFDFAGLLPQDTAPLALLAIAFIPCLFLSLAWRGTLKKLEPPAA